MPFLLTPVRATGVQLPKSRSQVSDGQHKKAEVHTAKAPAHENQRLCLVPHTAVFLDGIRLGCRTGGEGVWPSPSVPPLPFREQGTAGQPAKNSSAQWLFYERAVPF